MPKTLQLSSSEKESSPQAHPTLLPLLCTCPAYPPSYFACARPASQQAHFKLPLACCTKDLMHVAFEIWFSAQTSSKHPTGLKQLCKDLYECLIMSRWWDSCHTAKRTLAIWQSKTFARNVTFGSVSGNVFVRVSSVVMPLSALCGKAAGSLCCSWRHIYPCKQCAAQASVYASSVIFVGCMT